MILADEMGLGKTAQTVCMLEHLRGMEHVRGPFLIIVPLSTVEHWKREIEDWTTCVHVVGACRGRSSCGLACAHCVRLADIAANSRARYQTCAPHLSLPPPPPSPLLAA